jgi:hypothetical protein
VSGKHELELPLSENGNQSSDLLTFLALFHYLRRTEINKIFVE